MIHRGYTMPFKSAVYLCLAVAASALAGCAPPLGYSTVYWGDFPQQPPDYSPDYTRVPVVAARHAKVREQKLSKCTSCQMCL